MVFAILALTVWSTLRGKPRVEAFGRTIPDALVHKSATLIVMSLATVMLATAVLVATETSPANPTIEPFLFEATSAFGTTGLSMGITSELGVPGRIAIIVAMFVGRVGPLAVLAALLAIGAGRRTVYEYPTEEVVIY
jgi:trk/ktr system potassium uptake protein